jgi:HAD superfamily hydrolase (TIGR01484 family)
MKILSLDIDGTLIDKNIDHNVFMDDLIELSKFCVNKKIEITLVTGRNLEEVYEDRALLDVLKPIFIITNCGMNISKKVNGNYITLSGYEEILSLTCDKELLECEKFIKNILPEIKIQEIYRQFKFKKSYYIEDRHLRILENKKKEINELFAKTEIIATFCNREPHYLDLQHISTTKFGALNYVIDKELQISLNEVIYFGDNGNDMPCFLNLNKSYLFNFFEEPLKLFYKIGDSNKFLNAPPGPRSILFALSQLI